MVYIVQKRFASRPTQEFYGPFSSVDEAASWAQRELGEGSYDIRSVTPPWK